MLIPSPSSCAGADGPRVTGPRVTGPQVTGPQVTEPLHQVTQPSLWAVCMAGSPGGPCVWWAARGGFVYGGQPGGAMCMVSSPGGQCVWWAVQDGVSSRMMGGFQRRAVWPGKLPPAARSLQSQEDKPRTQGCPPLPKTPQQGREHRF